MEVLEFIFVLGINFSIFGFIWGLLMILVKLIRSGLGRTNQAEIYGLRIVKYFMLVSVTAHYVHVYQSADIASESGVSRIIVGVLVMGLYLLGKLQSRTILNALSSRQVMGPFSFPPIDIKVERFLLLGSLIYFIACLLMPWMVDNGLTNWFTSSIISIYEAPVIGWIFKIIAFFFLISILLRAANVIGRIISGQPIVTEPKIDVHFRGGSNPFDQFRERQQNDPEWTDYEEVKDEEDRKEKEKE
jgi:hypothetical protein